MYARVRMPGNLGYCYGGWVYAYSLVIYHTHPLRANIPLRVLCVPPPIPLGSVYARMLYVYQPSAQLCVYIHLLVSAVSFIVYI